MKVQKRRPLLWLILFAIAMAQVEASVVIHLRSVYYPDHPLELFPLSLLSQRDLYIELVREAATVIMILTVALLSERGFVRVFAAFVYVFGLWDIFYYIWLKLMIGWPSDWLGWDILFLIPWPWFGPWFTPVLISLLFIAWGQRVMSSAREFHFTLLTSASFLIGTALALTAFLLPAYPMLVSGAEAFRNFQPPGFPWLFYVPGLVLMAYGLWGVTRRGDIRL